MSNDFIIDNDKTREITLEINVWSSSSKSNKNIDFRYFYITDRLTLGDVTHIVPKPTEMISIDFLTKTL